MFTLTEFNFVLQVHPPINSTNSSVIRPCACFALILVSLIDGGVELEKKMMTMMIEACKIPPEQLYFFRSPPLYTPTPHHPPSFLVIFNSHKYPSPTLPPPPSYYRKYAIMWGYNFGEGTKVSIQLFFIFCIFKK